MPSASIEPAQAPGDAGQAPPATAGNQAARNQAKLTRKAAAPGHGPTLIEAELIGDGGQLRLHFSEPIAAADGVDPNDFRISVAMAYMYKRYAYAYYYDAGLVDSDQLMAITSMRGQGDTLDLYLDPPFDPAYCQELQVGVQEMLGEPGVRANGGLFLHYAPGDVPITDPQGNHMPAIAAEWVLRKRRGEEDAEEMYLEGPRARRALRDAIPVGCGPGDGR